MEKKSKVINVSIIFLLVIIFYFLQKEYEMIRNGLDMSRYELYRLLVKLNMLAIGIAVEGKRVVGLIHRKWNISWGNFFLSIVLVLSLMLPWKFGDKAYLFLNSVVILKPIAFYFLMIRNEIICSVICLLGGIAIMRSLVDSNSK